MMWTYLSRLTSGVGGVRVLEMGGVQTDAAFDLHFFIFFRHSKGPLSDHVQKWLSSSLFLADA